MPYVPVPDRPDLSPLTPPRGRHAIEFLTTESGASPRQINYWRASGYLGDHLPLTPGTGRPVPWRAADLAVLTALVAVSTALEPRAGDAWRVVADAARDAARRFDCRAVVDLPGGIVLVVPVRVDWWRYALRHDDKDAQPVGPPSERHAR